MTAGNHKTSFGSYAKNDHNDPSVTYQQTIATCRKLIVGSFTKCFSFLDTLDNGLFTLVRQAESNLLQDKYISILNKFQTNQESIKQEYSTLILADYDSFWLYSSAHVANSDTVSLIKLNSKLELSLNNETEQDSIISDIIAKSDSILGQELLQLSKRFTSMLGSDQLIEIPLSPKRLIDHLQTITSSISSDLDVKLITLRQFEQYALLDLLDLYTQLNNKLFKQGILPHLALRTIQQTSDHLPITSTLNDEFNATRPLLVEKKSLSPTAISKTNISHVSAKTPPPQKKSAERRVNHSINDRLLQHDLIPDKLAYFIKHSWQHLLHHHIEKNGYDSSQWKENISLLDKLLWSVTPKSNNSDRKKLLALIPILLKSLRQELKLSELSAHTVATFFRDIQQCHAHCLHTIPTEERMSDENAFNIANQLQVGTWLDVKTEKEKQVQRLKFSWRSHLTGRCLFVTHLGIKAAEPTLAELAKWFQLGHITIVEQA